MLTKLGVLTISVQVKIKCALGTIVKIILVGVRWRDIELFKTLFGLNIKTSENIQSGLEHLKPVIIDLIVCLLGQVCSADAEMKKINAERSRLKLEKERGTLVPRGEVEEALAARALFFRNEIENFGLRKAGEIIDLVRGDPAMQEAFMDWWRDETADWMDAWSGEMSFGGSEDGDDLGPEDA